MTGAAAPMAAPMTRRAALLVLTMAALTPRIVSTAFAQSPAARTESRTADATAPVARLNEALLDLMRRGGREPKRARMNGFLPVLEELFDLETALRIAAAPYFDGAGEAERRQALDAFARRSAAQYVDRFDSYSGQTLAIEGERPGPRGMTLVDTSLVRPGKAPVRLTYVLREEGGRWRILDVLAKGTVSQLAAQRSEFQTALRKGGLAELTRDLNSNADRLLGGA